MLHTCSVDKRRDNELYGSWPSLCRTSFLSFTHGGGVSSCWNKLSPPGNLESIKGCKWSAAISVCVTLVKADSIFTSGLFELQENTQHTITDLLPSCTTLLPG